MHNFHIIFSEPITSSAQEIWRIIGFQVNYLGVKGNGLFLQTNSNKNKGHMWRSFSKVKYVRTFESTVKYVRTFESTRLPNGMTSEKGTFNGTRLPRSRMTSEIGDLDYEIGDLDYEAALADFNEQHPFETTPYYYTYKRLKKLNVGKSNVR